MQNQNEQPYTCELSLQKGVRGLDRTPERAWASLWPAQGASLGSGRRSGTGPVAHPDSSPAAQLTSTQPLELPPGPARPHTREGASTPSSVKAPDAKASLGQPARGTGPCKGGTGGSSGPQWGSTHAQCQLHDVTSSMTHVFSGCGRWGCSEHGAATPDLPQGHLGPHVLLPPSQHLRVSIGRPNADARALPGTTRSPRWLQTPKASPACLRSHCPVSRSAGLSGPLISQVLLTLAPPTPAPPSPGLDTSQEPGE